MRYLLAFALCAGMWVTTAPADDKKPADPVKKEEPKKGVVREIDVSERRIPFRKDAKLDTPEKFTTAKELKESSLDVLGSGLKVDFKTEYVLLFQWEGSEKDTLTPSAETKDGKTIVTFTLKPEKTKDLSNNSRVFVLPAGADWKVAK